MATAGRTPLDYFMLSLSTLTQGSFNLEETLKPQPLSKDKVTEIAGLEQGGQVWFVDFHAAPTQDDETPGGYVNLLECVVALVEKETGSNGKPWRHNWTGRREDGEEDCDGLSSHLGHCAQPFCLEESIPSETQNDFILSTVAQACLRQGCRPLKVLFRMSGAMNAVSKKLKKMGIHDVGIAEDSLIVSMTTSFTNAESRNRELEGLLPASLSDFRDISPLALAAALNGSRRTPESPYVSEERVPLGRYRPDEKELALFPLEWWARPPSANGSYRTRMLWGWRTNLEIASDGGDVEKIRALCATHSAELCRDLAERRILLTKAAQNGRLSVCQALVEDVGVSVNGAQDQHTRPEWKRAAKSSGDEGSSPLSRAARYGNTQVVRYLVAQKAAINFRCGPIKGTPLHHAVVAGHLDVVKALLAGGADATLEDVNGLTAAVLAELQLQGKLGARKGNEAHRKILVFLSNPDVDDSACAGAACLLLLRLHLLASASPRLCRSPHSLFSSLSLFLAPFLPSSFPSSTVEPSPLTPSAGLTPQHLSNISRPLRPGV